MLQRWNPRVLAASRAGSIAQEMRRAGCPPADVQRRLSETDTVAVALEGVDRRAADILRKAMREIGGDAVLRPDAAPPSAPGENDTDVVLLGTRRALAALPDRLSGQPFDLPALAAVVADALARHEQREFELPMGAYRLRVGARPLVMGVINVTPDSFSDGGLYLAAERAVAHAQRLLDEGADLMDVGGESTRPGSDAVGEEEEMRRVLPVVETLAEKIPVPISIDTRHARVAREAVCAGAAIVNDITGLHGDPQMAPTVAETGAGVVIMHILGEPKTMQDHPEYDHLMADVCRYLRQGLAMAEEAGVPEERTIVDPGIGFGKRLEHNLEILAQLGQIRTLGRPILVGPSRKRFIGELTGVESPADRKSGTAAACALAVAAGARILRVHDVAEMRQAIAVASAIAQAAENLP